MGASTPKQFSLSFHQSAMGQRTKDPKPLPRAPPKLFLSPPPGEHPPVVTHPPGCSVSPLFSALACRRDEMIRSKDRSVSWYLQQHTKAEMTANFSREYGPWFSASREDGQMPPMSVSRADVTKRRKLKFINSSFFSHHPGGQNMKSRCWPGPCTPGSSEEESFPVSSSLGGCQQSLVSLACSHITRSRPHFHMAFLTAFVSISVPPLTL